MNKALRKRLDVVWAKGTALDALPSAALLTHRYVPRAIGMGPGWGVFDRKQERHLSDKEVSRLSVDALALERFLQ